MKHPFLFASQKGAVDPRLLLGVGVGLALLLTWVFLSNPPSPADVLPTSPALRVPQLGSLAEAGSLEIEQGGPLPGVGPLQVELRYLGSRDDSLIQVQRPGVLQGVVYGPDGKAAAGVQLRIEGGPQNGLLAFSNSDGVYRLQGLIPGLHFVRLSASFLPEVVRLQRALGHRETSRDFFVGQSMSVTLHIVDHKNKNLAEAVVCSDLGLHCGTTNEKGLVQIDNISGGRRVVFDVRAQGHVPVRYEMNLFPGLLTESPIDLPPLPVGGKIRGRVKSWPGGALPTITMVPRATRLGAYQVIWEEWQGVSTDREGRYVLENVPITHLLDVRAFHPRGVSDPRMRAVQPSVSSAASADFVIRQAHAVVRGEVVDEAGKPLPEVDLRLEAVNPDKVLAALYPGLGESPVGVRLPVPAQLLREAQTDRAGKFAIALGDHPQGTGHLLLTVAAKGKRVVRREVKVVGKKFHVVLQELHHQSSLQLIRSDEGPIPAAEVVLDGVVRENLRGLEQGFYRVSVRRGDLRLKQVEQLWIEGETGLDLRP